MKEWMENLFHIFFFIKIWYSCLKSSTCLDSKRRLVYADKTIDLSSSHGVHYLVHSSAL